MFQCLCVREREERDRETGRMSLLSKALPGERWLGTQSSSAGEVTSNDSSQLDDTGKQSSSIFTAKCGFQDGKKATFRASIILELSKLLPELACCFFFRFN